MIDRNFDAAINDTELAACTSFKDVPENFLGKSKVENHEEIVENISQHFHNYRVLGCNMPLDPFSGLFLREPSAIRLPTGISVQREVCP